MNADVEVGAKEETTKNTNENSEFRIRCGFASILPPCHFDLQPTHGRKLDRMNRMDSIQQGYPSPNSAWLRAPGPQSAATAIS